MTMYSVLCYTGMFQKHPTMILDFPSETPRPHSFLRQIPLSNGYRIPLIFGGVMSIVLAFLTVVIGSSVATALDNSQPEVRNWLILATVLIGLGAILMFNVAFLLPVFNVIRRRRYAFRYGQLVNATVRNSKPAILDQIGTPFLRDRSRVIVEIEGQQYSTRIQGRGWKLINYPKDELLQPNDIVPVLFVPKKKLVILPGDLNIALRTK